MAITEIHARLGNTAMLYALILTLWGLWRYFRQQGINSNYWGALVVAEVVFLVQAGLGLFMWLSGSGELAGQYIHILYGVVSILVIPGVYIYTRGDESRRSMVVFSLACLFLVGIALRSMATAP